jgi:predicted HTH transcriptional regulator
MSDNDDKQYKSIDSAFAKQIRSDLETNMEKFRDPIILGELAYRLTEERENTNRLLKNILQKLEALENRLASPESDTAHMEVAHPSGMEDLLPEIDEQILAFIREAKKATAEEVRARFNYKGKNAASARLNRLCGMGVLLKKQVGRKMYFFPS